MAHVMQCEIANAEGRREEAELGCWRRIMASYRFVVRNTQLMPLEKPLLNAPHLQPTSCAFETPRPILIVLSYIIYLITFITLLSTTLSRNLGYYGTGPSITCTVTSFTPDPSWASSINAYLGDYNSNYNGA